MCIASLIVSDWATGSLPEPEAKQGGSGSN
jgi:hypothetical protein